jgi:uncharacterized protein YndB with AHSA1/START domain
MRKKIAIVVFLLLATPFVVAATKPDTIQVQRTTSIQAPPEKIFAHLDDFHRWSAWSPYEQLDPTMKKTYSGPANGNGAVYEWDGNDKVGAGRMEITDSSPSSKVVIKLDFIKPFEGHNVAEFTLVPQGDGTTVTWAMHGPSPYLMKLMCIFINVDEMIGKDFETGLSNLKALAEA